MKTFMTFFAVAALAVTASAASNSAPKTKKGAPAARPAANVIQPLTIPKDAVPAANGTFSYTDKDGKKWIYSNSPFGVSRVADMGLAAASAPAALKIIDLGDTVRIEQPGGPFGVMSTVKKKSELTEEERRQLAAQNAEAQNAGQK